MTLKEAMRLPHNTTIPSIEVDVNACFGHRSTTKGDTMTTYSISDGEEEALLRFFFIEKVTLFAGCRYYLQSVPTDRGMKGIKVNEFKGRKTIECQHTVHFDLMGRTEETRPQPIKEEEMTDLKEQNDPAVPQPPFNKDQLTSYFLSVYFMTRDKALTKEGVTKEEAHALGIEAMSLIPKYFFGAKPLPF